MSGEAKYTERDLVLAKREAYVEGRCEGWGGLDIDPASIPGAVVQRFVNRAVTLFSHPKVERPRVVPDPHEHGVFWCVGGGWLRWKDTDDGDFWTGKAAFAITPQRVELWASLLANPTELVDQPSVSGGTA